MVRALRPSQGPLYESLRTFPPSGCPFFALLAFDGLARSQQSKHAMPILSSQGQAQAKRERGAKATHQTVRHGASLREMEEALGGALFPT